VDTEQLIQTLARDVEPVTPLRRPSLRATAWVVGAAVYLAALIAVMSPRDDLGARVQDTWFLIEQGAALLMGVTAAAAALASVVPGRPRHILLLPLGPLAVWLGMIGFGALQDAQTLGLGGILLQVNWRCVTAILAGAAVPAVAMAFMVRRGAPLTPRLTAGLGGLAAAGLGNFAVCLSHPHGVDLIWHAGTVLLLAAAAAWIGSHLLRWPQSTRPAHSS
jgi:hypothetical protein